MLDESPKRTMTEVKVDFIGQFRQITGLNQVVLKFERQATLGDLIRNLTEKFGKELEERVLERGQITEDVLVILNGRSIRPTDMDLVVLSHGDNLVLAPESAP